MDFELLKTGIYNWVISVIPISTIFLNQDGSIPSLPFCTLYVQPITFFGHDEFKNDDNGLVTYTGQREFTLTVEYFGLGAMQNAHDLVESLEMQNARDLLAESDLVFVDRASGVQDLSELVDTGFEERASIDLILRTASIRTQAGTIIDSSQTTGDLIKADDSMITRVIDIDTTP